MQEEDFATRNLHVQECRQEGVALQVNPNEKSR